MPNDFMFSLFPVLFIIVFVIILGTIIVTLVKGISQWNKNNHSPKLSTPATVVTKRENVSRHHHSNDNNTMSTSSFTTYYVTFEVPSGDRMEFLVSDYEYGMLVEGDKGTLTFQGTRYISFNRL